MGAKQSRKREGGQKDQASVQVCSSTQIDQSHGMLLSFQRLVNGPKYEKNAAVALKNKIYSFGGYCLLDKRMEKPMDINIFDTDLKEWFKVANQDTESCPPHLNGLSAVVYKNLIYIWGGLDCRNHRTTKVYCFDPDGLQWRIVETTGQEPRSTDGHTACVIGSFMYIFGGFKYLADTLLSALYRLDLDTFEWERVSYKGTPPVERGFHTASAIGNRMYIFGGSSYQDYYTENIVHNEIFYFDTSTMTWEKPEVFGAPPCGRSSHSAVVYNGEIYIIGGWCSEWPSVLELQFELQFLNDVHKFNPVQNEWTELSIKKFRPCRRKGHCSVVIGEQLYLFGGTSPIDPNTPECDWPDPVEGEMFPPRVKPESDIFLIDFFPSLKRLAQLTLIDYDIPLGALPQKLQLEILGLQATETRINHSR